MTYLLEATHVFSLRWSVTLGPQVQGLPPQGLKGSASTKGGRSSLAADDSQTIFPLLVDVLGVGNDTSDH